MVLYPVTALRSALRAARAATGCEDLLDGKGGEERDRTSFG